MVEQIKADADQITNRQAQLEETVGAMSQEIGTIKQLLKRLLIPRAPTATRGEAAIEERRAEQQASKTSTLSRAASGLHENSHQVPRSQVESTHSAAPNNKRTHTRLDHRDLIMERCQVSHRGS